jgi:hypothetical protein
MIAKISVAYGYKLAGVGGGELSLGEIAQSGNTVRGRRPDGRVNLAGVASAAQDWLLAGIADGPLAASHVPIVRKRTGGETRGKAEIQVIERKQVILRTVVTDTFLLKTLHKRLYS